jgi:ribosomal protein L11 methyltransferase
LVVGARDETVATALLETTSGALAAIEDAGVRCGRDSIVTPLRRVTVHVPRADANKATRLVTRALSVGKARRLLRYADLAVDDVDDGAWATSWRKHYAPIHIAPGLFIVPTWDRTFAAPAKSAVVRLDPGMAFGTGQHASTQVAVNLLLPYVRRGSIVVDVGCGSGILALAAAKSGARVYATDTDPIALDAARANFKANRLIPVRLIHAAGIPRSFPKAHCIVANITAPVIERFAPALAQGLRHGGTLITSGFVEGSARRVRRALEAQGLKLVESGGRAQLAFEQRRARITGRWRGFVYRKPMRARA